MHFELSPPEQRSGGSLRGHKQGRGDGSAFGPGVAHRTPHMGKPISPNHTKIGKNNFPN